MFNDLNWCIDINSYQSHVTWSCIDINSYQSHVTWSSAISVCFFWQNDTLYHTSSRFRGNDCDGSPLPSNVSIHQHSHVSRLAKTFQADSNTSRLSSRPHLQTYRENSFRTMTSPTAAESDGEFPAYEDDCALISFWVVKLINLSSNKHRCFRT